MSSPKKPDGLTIFFPVYKDEATVENVTRKSLKVASELTENYEVIIINDNSPDRAGEIADRLARENPRIRVVHHEKNLGYGAALRSGFKAASYDWVGFTDGDDEYDIEDLKKLYKLRAFYDLVITFRYVKLYSGFRVLVSFIYNFYLRFLFRTQFRDISTGLRLVRHSILDDIELNSTSPFIGAELTIKTMLKGYRIGEVGIQTFPREFGRGSSTSFKNILKTIKEMRETHQSVFSTTYDLPANRVRN
jgi:glycosyltransferase involved in cell wall biosynthesis